MSSQAITSFGHVLKVTLDKLAQTNAKTVGELTAAGRTDVQAAYEQAVASLGKSVETVRGACGISI